MVVLSTALNLELTKDDESGEIKKTRWLKVDSRGKEGIEQVTAVGFGVTLIRREVFEKLGTPWFDAQWSPRGIIGEADFLQDAFQHPHGVAALAGVFVGCFLVHRIGLRLRGRKCHPFRCCQLAGLPHRIVVGSSRPERPQSSKASGGRLTCFRAGQSAHEAGR